MTDFFRDNPFNCESIYMDIDPLYAITAEDRDTVDSLLYLPETADLRTYVEARYASEYESAIRKAVEQGDIPLNRSTAKVPYPLAARVTDCRIKRLEASRRESARQGIFNIDAVVIVDMEIYQPTESGNESGKPIDCYELLTAGIPLIKDHARQWYRIRGYMDLVGRETNLVRSITIYDRRDKRGEMGYSDSLIPILSRMEMDGEAERLLRKYGMEDALNHCVRIDALALAGKMGLTVIPARLSKGNRIRGQLFLHDASVKVYREGKEAYIDVHSGTILYDPVVCDSQERINETIIHECVHFDLHGLFYTLQREYNDSIDFLACMDSRLRTADTEEAYELWLENESRRERAYDRTNRERTEIEWAEWQARGMTPRIQMPAKQTRRKIESLITQYSCLAHKGMATVYSKVIPELAGFYRVSWTTAKIRMIELGYDEARGILNYVDGAYVPAYTTSTGKIEPWTSYDISEVGADRLYKNDPLFASVIDSGRFVYVENHYCLDDPGFVHRNSTGICLTDQARHNIDLCCLLFKVSYGYRNNRYDRKALHSDDLKSDPVAVALASIPLEVLLAESQSVDELCMGLPRRFGKTLKYHREQKKLTQQQLAEMIGLDSKQISRWETEEVRPTQSQIGAFGVLMHLKGAFTEDLMNKVKAPINVNDSEDMALRFVIYYMYMRPLEECNQVLRARGCRPLAISSKAK